MLSGPQEVALTVNECHAIDRLVAWKKMQEWISSGESIALYLVAGRESNV